MSCILRGCFWINIVYFNIKPICTANNNSFQSKSKVYRFSVYQSTYSSVLRYFIAIKQESASDHLPIALLQHAPSLWQESSGSIR